MHTRYSVQQIIRICILNNIDDPLTVTLLLVLSTDPLSQLFNVAFQHATLKTGSTCMGRGQLYTTIIDGMGSRLVHIKEYIKCSMRHAGVCFFLSMQEFNQISCALHACFFFWVVKAIYACCVSPDLESV